MALIVPHAENEKQLPWWTWVAPLPLFLAGSLISLLFKFDTGVGSFYLPTAIAAVLVNWWGPKRTLPWLYISSTILTPLWGVETWWHWFAYPLNELLYATLSWFLFTHLAKGKYWLPDTKQFVSFILLGLLIPILADLLFLQMMLTYFGEQPASLFWNQFMRNWLGEFTANFGICPPILFSFTRFLQKRNLLVHPPPFTLPSPKYRYSRLEPLIIYSALFVSSFFIPFEKYWFLYGVAGLFIAIRIGFGEALFCNLFVFIITYIIPAFFVYESYFREVNMGVVFNIFLGNILLSVFVAITGRVISDLRNTEDKLQLQFEELNQTNQELDRFVYSVSHDLSAPLKSVQGLINISKMDSSSANKEDYLLKIEKSVSKLDLFIREILDYSRNKRIEITNESIHLKAMCEEIIENLRYMDNFQKILFDLSAIDGKIVNSDSIRLRIILNNLLSNAIKFQKRLGDQVPSVKLSYAETEKSFKIISTDNGEGIKPELKDKIFEMFFRGNANAVGSGLGLYIAQEAAQKLGGRISIESEYGQGSTFMLELPRIK